MYRNLNNKVTKWELDIFTLFIYFTENESAESVKNIKLYGDSKDSLLL